MPYVRVNDKSSYSPTKLSDVYLHLFYNVLYHHLNRKLRTNLQRRPVNNQRHWWCSHQCLFPMAAAARRNLLVMAQIVTLLLDLPIFPNTALHSPAQMIMAMSIRLRNCCWQHLCITSSSSASAAASEASSSSSSSSSSCITSFLLWFIVVSIKLQTSWILLFLSWTCLWKE